MVSERELPANVTQFDQRNLKMKCISQKPQPEINKNKKADGGLVNISFIELDLTLRTAMNISMKNSI